MKKVILWIICIILVSGMVLVMSSGCTSQGAAAETTAAAGTTAAAAGGNISGSAYDIVKMSGEKVAAVEKGKGKGVIAILSNTADIPIMIAQKGQNEATAAKYGYETVYFNSDWDMATQADQIETAIEMGVDGMIIVAIDEKAIIPTLQKVKDAGIPVVTEDGGALESPETTGLVVCNVAADNFRAGELAAEYIAWRLKGIGKVAVSGYESVKPGRDRTNGVYNVLKHYPQIEIAAYGEGASVPSGLEVTEDFIQRVPDLDAIYAVNDPFGEGAYQAVLAAGKQDQIFICGNDGDPAALELIRSTQGKTYAYSSAQWPQIMGVVAMENLIAAIEGRDEDIIANVEQQGVHQSWPTFAVAPFPVSIETIDSYPGWDVAVDWKSIAPYPIWWQ